MLLDHAGEAKLGQAADRHHAARHRPLLRRQGRAPGHPRAGPARREDPQEEDRRRDGAQAPRAAPVREGARARPAVDDRGLPDLRPPDRAVRRRHRQADLGRARRAAATSCSRARRARCWTSTTARIRSSPRRTRSPPRPAPAPASARRTSTRSGASPRPTPRASAPARSRPSSTTSSATTLREAGGEYGTTTGRAAPRRLDRPRRAALRRAHQLAHAPGDHQARRADRPRRRSTSAPATAAPKRRPSTTIRTTRP